MLLVCISFVDFISCLELRKFEKHVCLPEFMLPKAIHLISALSHSRGHEKEVSTFCRIFLMSNAVQKVHNCILQKDFSTGDSSVYVSVFPQINIGWVFKLHSSRVFESFLANRRLKAIFSNTTLMPLFQNRKKLKKFINRSKIN